MLEEISDHIELWQVYRDLLKDSHEID